MVDRTRPLQSRSALLGHRVWFVCHREPRRELAQTCRGTTYLLPGHRDPSTLRRSRWCHLWPWHLCTRRLHLASPPRRQHTGGRRHRLSCPRCVVLRSPPNSPSRGPANTRVDRLCCQESRSRCLFHLSPSCRRVVAEATTPRNRESSSGRPRGHRLAGLASAVG